MDMDSERKPPPIELRPFLPEPEAPPVMPEHAPPVMPAPPLPSEMRPPLSPVRRPPLPSQTWPLPTQPLPRSPSARKARGILMPIGAALLLIAKFFGKVKFVLIPLLKYFPVLLKTGGSMFLTIGLYALSLGWWFALGFVLLIFVHECGHLLAAKRVGLKVGAPVFIPFMGAIIALKEAPRNAWIEAQVGLGGPLLGTVGAVACGGLYLVTGNPLFRVLAYMGFLLNLFNLAPLGILDGGRIVTALSPWLWLVGLVIVGMIALTHFNFIVLLIVVLSAPRLLFLFRQKTDEERRYFEVTPAQRAIMAVLYFGLVAFLVVAMTVAYHVPPGNRGD